MIVCLWMIMECRNFPGVRIALGRQELKRLKETTMVTLLSKAHPALGVMPHEYIYNEQKGVLSYVANGSQIQLIDMAYAPKDPDYDTYGSLEFTHVVIEEVGEVRKKAVDVLGSRKNRFMNAEYGIVGKTVMTCNPTNNFIKKEYYEPYKRLGAGRSQKWPHGSIILPTGEKVQAYRSFIRSLAMDNPFVDANYVETLKNLPDQERKRLYEGNWDYLDDDDMLFKGEDLDRATVYEYHQPEAPVRFLGVDVADKGKDKTVVTLIEDNVIIKQVELQVQKTGEVPISELYALELIKFAQQNGFTQSIARQIAVEGNGVGVGVRDFMRSKGWFITEYTATSQTRSAGYWQMHLDIEAAALRVLSTLPTLTDLRDELMKHTYTFNDKLEPVVVKKKEIKEDLGRSPDYADSAMIASWISHGGHGSSTNTEDLIDF